MSDALQKWVLVIITAVAAVVGTLAVQNYVRKHWPGVESPAESPYDRQEVEDSPTLSLVLVVSKPPTADRAALAKAIGQAFGRPLGSDEEAAEYLAGTGPVYMLKIEGFLLELHLMEGDDPAKIADPQLRQQAVGQQGWIAVYFIGVPADKAQAYRVMGKALSALADENTLAVIAEDEGLETAWLASMKEKLRSDDPLSIFAHPAETLTLDPDDPDMQAAIAQARRSWNEFAQAFLQNKPGRYLAKFRFSEGDHSEYLWVEARQLTPTHLTGKLDSAPRQLSSLRQGDTIVRPTANALDWLILLPGGKQSGGFTERVLAIKGRPSSAPASSPHD
jgi:uncharacterized protein YegJ (DUF2314 family)